MTGAEINRKIKDANHRLEQAAMTFERSDAINNIYEEILHLQSQCPHFDNVLNYEIIDGRCPYCYKKIYIKQRE